MEEAREEREKKLKFSLQHIRTVERADAADTAPSVLQSLPIHILAVAGELDYKTVKEMEANIQLFQSQHSPGHLLLDCGNLFYADSSGLMWMLQQHRQHSAIGRHLCFFGFSTHVLRSLKTIRLDRMLNISPSVETALARIGEAESR